MKFPSEYTNKFAISTSDNGYILYYEHEIIDLGFPTKRSTITKSRIYPETLDGQKELMEDMLDLLGWFTSKRKGGLQITVVNHE